MKWCSVFNPCAYFRKAIQYYGRIQDKVFEKNYNIEEVLKNQKAIFAEMGLDYSNAKSILNRTLAQIPLLKHIFEESRVSMFSEHWTVFAALEAAKIHRILELGTHNGEFANFLSYLFPESEIITLDLPDDSPSFTESYGRDVQEYKSDFIAHRSKMLNRPNIRYVPVTSFLLPCLGLGTFDLIWVDDCHEYPDVAWDTCNAWHLCNKGGWIFFDDIYLSEKPIEKYTTASKECLMAFKKYEICDVKFIYKRLSAKFSANPRRRKHIGIIHKML